MGSSDDDPKNCNTKAIDASIGGLVWVRRRNGSWWPGQIMGLHEISEGNVASPKLGTPVKLLGRDDATVDWYNLEKSKRVKAFRCGEYDECIEKAKSAVANGNKKAVKYARREDAILHALEIENARLGKDWLDFSRTNNISVEHVNQAKESPTMSLPGKQDNDNMTDEQSDSGNVSLESNSGLDSGSDSAPKLSQSGISCEESNLVGASKVQSLQGKRRRTPNDSEDDGTQGIKRMRGLQDLGMGVADSNAGNCMSNGCSVDGPTGYNLSKRKRSQVANIHELMRRKNRSRPLKKVLESTAMVCIPINGNQLPSSSGSPLQCLSDSKVSVIESSESRKNFSMATNNNSDRSAHSCENGAYLNHSEHVGDASHLNCNVKENGVSGISGLADYGNSDRLFDLPFVGEEKHFAGVSPVFVPSSGKQQVGGLRRQVNQSSQVESVCLKNEGRNESVSMSSAAFRVNIGQSIEKGTSKWQLKGKRNSRRKRKSRKQTSKKYVALDVEANAYLDRKVTCDGSRKSLASYNCDLQTKSKAFAEDLASGVWEWSKSSSHQEPQMRGPTEEVLHLPQRSLPYRQSRFTINPRYRTSDFPGRTFGTNSKLYDIELEVKASYQPPHVPLVSLMSKLNGKAIVGHPQTVEPLYDGFCDDMAPSKSPKPRKPGLVSKKIRKLSSLTGSKEDRKLVLEKPKGTVIACIPLKLVFSRINEAVNGLARQTHCAITSSNSVNLVP